MKKSIALLLLTVLTAMVLTMGAIGQTEPIQYDYEHMTVAGVTPTTGNFFCSLWGNVTSDMDVRLLLHGYNLVEWDTADSLFRIDDTVVSGIIVTEDGIGNRTYTIALYNDLYYSDGTRITAADYAFSMLLTMSPEMSAIGGNVKRPEYLKVWDIVRESKVEHPKISRILSLVSQMLAADPKSKVIVFTQYRESCDVISEKLSKVTDARVCTLIGQANGGLKQKEQIEILDKFRKGIYNVVVSTSVGEEGLDIASTNAVIFYEPVPSEIRTIQRRGRTGRKNDGEVYVLVAAGTMDEAMEGAAKKKEQLMRDRLETLSGILRSKRGLPPAQKGLYEFNDIS